MLLDKELIKTRWASLAQEFSKRFGEVPDVKSILFLIGKQELINFGASVTKKGKQVNLEIIHVGLCTVLEKKGYYIRIGMDKEGWPHFRNTKKIMRNSLEFSHEGLIKLSIMDYLQNDTQFLA